MELSNLIPHIEALIFASDKPLTVDEMTELINNAFGFMEDKILPEQISVALEGIVEKYNSEFYPFSVRESGGGWQFLTKKEYHKTVAQLNGEKFLKRLSAAALETLAIIAYKQPITKGEIEIIRGVSSDYTVQKLLEKDLIIISGRNEQLPGHPLVYATSKSFMDYFGINSQEDLPKIKEVLADMVIEPTIVNHTDFEQSETLAITDDGELIDADAASYEPHINGQSVEEGDNMDVNEKDDVNEDNDNNDFIEKATATGEDESDNTDVNDDNEVDDDIDSSEDNAATDEEPE